MTEVALGLMSGTSGDGVSSALVAFGNRSFRLLAYETFPYPKGVQEKIARPESLRINEISELDFRLGQIFSRAALQTLKIARVSPRKVSVIGSHGQTLYHGPRDRISSTFQIGESAVIAHQTGIPVVSDFRPQDIVLGGEGAPLVPFFDHYFYGRGPVRAFQNIGGIANVTVVGRGLEGTIAFDTGPGNALIDLAIRKITKGGLSYDPAGKRAARGRVERRWIEQMSQYPYFRRRPPKSTGKEEFGERFLSKYLGAGLLRRPFDSLATLTYFTAWTIYEGLRRFAPPSLKEMIVSPNCSETRTFQLRVRISLQSASRQLQRI